MKDLLETAREYVKQLTGFEPGYVGVYGGYVVFIVPVVYSPEELKELGIEALYTPSGAFYAIPLEEVLSRQETEAAGATEEVMPTKSKMKRKKKMGMYY